MAEIEQAAEAVLIAREMHTEKTLAEMYDPDKMPANPPRSPHPPGSRSGKLLPPGSLHPDEERRLEHLFALYENDEEMKIYPNRFCNLLGLEIQIKNQTKMDNKQSISNIERQNVLNNRFAVEAIQRALNIEALHFDGQYCFTKQMVANFYEVEERTIETLSRNS